MSISKRGRNGSSRRSIDRLCDQSISETDAVTTAYTSTVPVDAAAIAIFHIDPSFHHMALLLLLLLCRR